MAAFRWLCVSALAIALFSGAAHAAQPRERQAATKPPAGAPPTPGQAPYMRIAAVVNDEIISVFDLVSRVRMVMMSSNIQDSPETRQKIAPQILRGLIDEKLELQEAKKKSVTAADSEVARALEQIVKQNNMKAGQLNEFLKARAIDRGALVDQLTAGIVWAKLVRRLAAQTTDISDEEIDEGFLQKLRDAGMDERELTGFYVTRPPGGGRPRFLFQRREKSRPASYPIHLDLATDDREAEIERLTEAGASVVSRVSISRV